MRNKVYGLIAGALLVLASFLIAGVAKQTDAQPQTDSNWVKVAEGGPASVYRLNDGTTICYVVMYNLTATGTSIACVK